MIELGEFFDALAFEKSASERRIFSILLRTHRNKMAAF